MKLNNRDFPWPRIERITFFSKLKQVLLFLKFKFFSLNKREKLPGRLIFNPDKSGWILKKIGESISLDTDNLSTKISDLNKYEEVVFLHYLPFFIAVKTGLVRAENSTVWFTHRKETIFPEREIVNVLIRSKKVVFQCQESQRYYEEKYQVSFFNSTVLWGGVDSLFTQPRTNTLSFLICSRYYERKNPEVIKKIVSAYKNDYFLVLGQGWENHLSGMNNVIFINSSYSNYPKIFEWSDVLLTTSYVEGGPIPVLEATAKDLIIVSSNTGVVCDDDWNYEKTIYINNYKNLDDLRNEIIQMKNQNEKSKKSLIGWEQFGVKFNG